MKIRWTLVLGCFVITASLRAESPGAELYKSQCARCHGPQGQGVAKKYSQPLAGELSIAQLSEVVRKTMPEDNPESLTPEQSTAIAAFMYDSFYSPIARERTRPARIDLTRLTVNQYRHSVSDILGSFRFNTNRWQDGGKGLKGEYFADRGYRNRQVERTDPTIQFDFGTNPPTEGKYPSPEYSVRWSGSLLAPESGEYTFIVKSDQAVLLYINGNEPLVDARVRSGNQTEYVVSLMLTGGRVVPIRLEFSKALQGVKDKAPKPTPAFVSLNWKPPHGQIEPIPTRFLSPVSVPDQHAVTIAFPPDDQSMGWERGSSVSKEWDAATSEAALEAAKAIIQQFNRISGVDARAPKPNQLQQAKQFAGKFVERAFRQPLTPDQRALYIDRQFQLAGDDLTLAMQRVVLLTLKSPRFLFRETAESADAYATASRLSFALWDSIPDQELLNAAAQGRLKTIADTRKQAERMLQDPRAAVKMRRFLMHWLRLDQERELVKNPKLFPEFEPILPDLKTSLELFLDEIVWSDRSDFRQLLLSDSVYLNGRLAKVYGVNLPADAPFQKVQLDVGKRSGVLTHPYLLSSFAYSEHSSPIHRGVFLAKGILGTGLKPPQDAFSPLAASAHPNLNTRERVLLQTKGANCQTCHSVINPLGFALESFDAIGKYRQLDNQKPIDARGEYITRSGTIQKFTGAVELAKFLANSPEVSESFTRQLFHHLIQQPIRAYGANRTEEYRAFWEQNGYNIRRLMIEIAATAALPRMESRQR
ncbi:DUF1592 domain-containing protein [Tuwongella immobilis]|uniref:PA14 domain-containing protein n=1 Tax=Tuwongella immobilis TaxID=692036 RepID=A0A6C2YPZ8_9BACT|nr:DUF1592 domain-containing protein [Tuwongella immobilis]VIP03546.1 secreted protein containing pa14 : Cytochrome c OS=Singulisphaera acidiphila (strain ATCC BAA-1392 / DSM 18658 / VKM B-2454 / MOB10) GN=Sinac_0939 PE=4 SV=1: Cytochrome_CBB3: PA14: PSD5: PSD4: PSCyt3 [Tuwongella immobilis]VTS04460.1 secreted protein containing pa14 : Cytochrome c OS=Singulisphaera acidiphila (strain ATCC BAA-1392 / DSM 18658 / VKM B-2454 / MOB10) GN=Sinac_0939 PE=4 SV=1: Cytochrome_CBB3: PA14: PSD5: PSD4: PSCyt